MKTTIYQIGKTSGEFEGRGVEGGRRVFPVGKPL